MIESIEIEKVWPLIHEAWRQEKLQAGVTSRPSVLSGQEQMVPAEELAEIDKESNRAQVRAVISALLKSGYVPLHLSVIYAASMKGDGTSPEELVGMVLKTFGLEKFNL